MDRRLIFTYLGAFLCGVFIMAGVLRFIYLSVTNTHQTRIEAKEKDYVNLQKSIITRHFYGIVSDLEILSEFHELKKLAGNSEAYAEQDLEYDFLSVSRRKTIYDQIRFIDKNGLEIIRVNYNNGDPQLVPDALLQNKAGRYYFKNAMAEGENQIYISPIDLNVENGRVERPFKPMLRFGTPVLDAMKVKQGVLILNYNASDLLSEFKNIPRNTPGKTWLLNKEGYWIVGSAPRDEWGFMFENGKQNTLRQRMPDAWKKIHGNARGQFNTSKGFFTFTEFQMDNRRAGFILKEAPRKRLPGTDTQVWKIVSYIPNGILVSELRSHSMGLEKKLIGIFIVLILFYGIIIYCLALAQQKKNQAEELIKQYNINLEKKVKQRTAELQKVTRAVEQSPAAVVITDPEGKIEYVNPIFSILTGYTADEAIGKTPRLLKADGVHSPEFYREMWKTIRAGQVWRGEMCNRKKNGKLYWENASISPIVNTNGEITHFVAVKEDITESRELQEQLVQQKKLIDMLHQSTTSFVEKGDFKAAMNNMLETLLEITGSEYGFVGEVLLDDDERPYLRTHAISNIAWDIESEKLYDASRESGFKFDNPDTLFGHVLTSGKSLMCTDPLSDPRAGGLPPGHPAMHSFLGMPIHYGNEMVGMYAIANRPGGYDTSLQAFLTPLNATYGVLINYRRIMDLKEQNRQALVEAKEMAESAARIKSDFLANMSHEIRTPLNAVLGFLDLVLEDSALSSRHKKHLTTAKTSAAVLLMLINDILDISKMENKKLAIEQGPFSLVQLMAEIQATMDITAREKGLILTFDIDPDIPGLMLGDPLRLQQIIVNLLSNAIKFTHEGKVAVIIVPAGKKDQIRFTIKDTGIGIPADRLETIFESFTQADPSTTRKFGGTGLGTTIARNLVALMGGKIWVESEEGKGSSFHFTITAPATDKITNTICLDDMCSSGEKSNGKISERCFRILVADDVPVNLELVRICLEKYGHEIITAGNGREVLEKISKENIDVILMDAHMPVMDGPEAAKQIRELEAGSDRHIPIIAMTAAVMEDETRQYIQSGMDAVLAKPIDFDNLRRMIDDIVPDDAGQPADNTKEPLPSPGTVEFPRLPGIDTQDGIKRWQDSSAYTRALMEFPQTYGDAAAKIAGFLEKGETKNAHELVHAIKGVAENLSMTQVASAAKTIDRAFKENRIQGVASHLPVLAGGLKETIHALGELEGTEEVQTSPGKKRDPESVKELLAKTRDAIDRYNPYNAQPFLSELTDCLGSSCLRPVTECLDRFDFAGANTELEKLAKTLGTYN